MLDSFNTLIFFHHFSLRSRKAARPKKPVFQFFSFFQLSLFLYSNSIQTGTRYVWIFAFLTIEWCVEQWWKKNSVSLKKKKNYYFFSTLYYRCLDNKLKISTDLLLSNTSREVTSTSVFFFSIFFTSFVTHVGVCELRRNNISNNE